MLGVLLILASRAAAGQERGAIALGEAVQGLGVNARVLMIGAHPDDEDTFLISWLSRGRHVETAYLSLTRGDGGQNLIGNELGEALGVIRTEELLAARRIDGARQYFTRAYDFGFSKDTADTYRHWQRDSILGDVVRVVRAFRPHVIVGVFSGTPRDGHGHHQVSGLLARAAYDEAGNTERFAAAAYGQPWTPLKFYRAARGNAQAGTVGFDAGEYSALIGRSYAEIAGESRSQHKSQGFGAPQRKGPVPVYLRREASRVNDATPAASERTLFDGIDTTWGRFRPLARDAAAAEALDSLPAALAAARRSFDPFRPGALVSVLARAVRLADAACPTAVDADCVVARAAFGSDARRDMGAAYAQLRRRLESALWMAAGLDLEALVARETFPLRTAVPLAVSLYNRGDDTVFVSRILPGALAASPGPGIPVAPGGVWRDSVNAPAYLAAGVTQPWWLAEPRVGAMFAPAAAADTPAGRPPEYEVIVRLGRGNDTISIDRTAPATYRIADPIRGEVRHTAAVVPATALMIAQRVQYLPANTEVNRSIDIEVRSADERPRDARVVLTPPRGLTADSGARTARLAGYNARQVLTFRLRGRLPAGSQMIPAFVESNGETSMAGYELIDYDHIRRQRIYHFPAVKLSVVDVRIPAALKVAYVPGVGDNVAPMLAQLGVPVTTIPAVELARANLSVYTTLVIGPRAYEAHPELVAANARVLDFARGGGTVVVQYGQYEMTEPGTMPYPVTIARPHDRVTHEGAPVTVVEPGAPVLAAPNRITDADFAGWVQERGLYMARTFDERYSAPLAMSDPGEQPIRGGLLVAPVGRGVYVYTSLSFFRQLPAGVPGAARLFVNLMSARQPLRPMQ